MKTILNATEYARHRGVSTTAVTLAVKSERLKESVVRDGKSYLINVEIADREWSANTDYTRLPRAGSKRSQAAAVKADPIATDDEIADGAIPDFSDSRAKREHHQAGIAELEHRKLAGELVPKSDVERDSFKAARRVRDAMLNVPDRISADLAAITDPFEVHARLTAEIRDALISAAQDIKAEHDDGLPDGV